jgi:hypothetical protein
MKNFPTLPLPGVSGSMADADDLFGVKQFKRRDDRRAAAVLTC